MLTLKIKDIAEQVVAGTGNILIKNATTDQLIESIPSTSSQVAIVYNSTTKKSTITITPSAQFTYGGTYYVEVAAGAFVDLLGNKIAAIHGKTSDGTGIGTWTFTAVNTDLTVTKVTPDRVENIDQMLMLW